VQSKMKKIFKLLFLATISIALLNLAGCKKKSSTPAVVNTAPVIGSISNQSTNEDTVKTVTLSVTDVDSGDSHTFIGTSSSSNVTTSISGTTLTLTPAANWNGTATISIKANDGTVDSATKTFTLTVSAVNDAPTLSAITNQNINENVTKTLTLSGSDLDAGDTLTYSATSSTSNVVPSISGTTLTLTPASNWFGTATITAKVNDGSVDSSSKTFTIKSWDLKSIPLLVVRMQWNDVTFTSNEATWATKIFGTSDTQLNHYMAEISGGRFQFTAAAETNGTSNNGIVTTTINKNHPNYGGTANKADQRAALTALDSSINFAAFDTDSNGYIGYGELQIIFLNAGGESAYGTSPGIWAHKSCDGSPPTLDSVVVFHCSHGTYSRFGERHGSHDATHGIIAHELGHAAFILPDLYDYTPSPTTDSEGIGNFGIMGGGTWANRSGQYAGDSPSHMVGWSKIASGFLDPITISSDGGYTTNQSTAAFHSVYKIATGTSGEYFLLENRDNVGYDRGLQVLTGTYDGGLLITHIDDNVANQNDETHKKVDVEEANDPVLDAKISRGDEDNLYYSGNSTTFNDTSDPNSKNYAGQATNISITSISAVGPAMTFAVDLP
jgi:M6 family metalloprotease-like protein